MPEIIIADTSCLIILNKIDQLIILKKLYSKIHVTKEVSIEFSETLPDWIEITEVSDLKYQNFLATLVDLGEASSIALAVEKENVLILLDDLKARKLAKKLNLKFTGTLGIIHKAKQKGVVKKVKPLIDKLIKTNFRISALVIDEFLKINGELN